MKKSTIKLIAMLLTVVLMLPNFAGVGALNENEVDDNIVSREEIDEIGRLEAPATKAYEEIMFSWMNDESEVQYPESFGGCYIDDDYNLAIKIVENDPELKAQICDIVTDCATVTFVETDISLNDLLYINRNLDTILPEMDIRQSMVCQRTSTVEVGVHNEIESYSIPSITIDSTYLEHLHFFEADPSTPMVSLNPGNTIGNETGTLGWYGTGYFGGTYKSCILTAGHVARELEGGNIVVNGSTVFYSNWWNSTNYTSIYYPSTAGTTTAGDYALLATTLTPTNTVKLSDTSSPKITKCMDSDIYIWLEGKTVYKAFGVSGMKTAKVCAIDTEAGKNEDGVIVTGLVSVEGRSFCINGDSGAPVLMKNSSQVDMLCGIITSKSNNISVCYFTPITLIVDNSGFTPYLG